MKISVDEYDTATVIVLAGEFFLSSIKDVEEAWEKALHMPPLIIGLDCRKLDFVDSSAIGTLVKMMNNAARDGKTLAFFDLNPSIARLFNTAKLHTVFSITTWKDFKKKYIES